jgi:hypothetical protein
MRKLILLVVLLLVLPGIARAADVNVPPASCFAQPERWSYDRDKQSIATVGEQFIADMQKCDPTFAAAVTEGVRYQIQKEETEKFLRQKDFVLAAYGIIWGILAVAGLALWLRQRRLVRELIELEARLKAAGAGTAS